MTKPWYLTLHMNGPQVQEYLAARLERHQAERDFMETERDTPSAWGAGAYMEAAWMAEAEAHYAACSERPGLPVGP